jgi:phosphoheptose isomerase
LAQKGDLIIGISTSGNSENVNLALTKAKKSDVISLDFQAKMEV